MILAAAHILWLAVVVTMQGWVLHRISWGGVHLELLPGVLVFHALQCRAGAAVGLALLAGLLADCLSATPLGQSAAMLALVVWVMVRLKEYVFVETFFTHFMLGLGATLGFLTGTLAGAVAAKGGVHAGGLDPWALAGWSWRNVAAGIGVVTLAAGLLTPGLYRLTAGALAPFGYRMRRPVEREVRR